MLGAEREAIATYRELINACRDGDPVTADLAVRIMSDEEEHRCLFEGFLKGLDRDHSAPKALDANAQTALSI